MNYLSDTDRAYIAGLMDGEGSISISRDRNVQRRNPKYVPLANVANTYSPVLYWLKATTGLGTVVPRERADKVRHKKGYQWNLRIEEMRTLLPVILPFMKIKHEQAALMLEFLAIRRPYVRNNEYTDQELVTMDVIFDELAELNKKGTS